LPFAVHAPSFPDLFAAAGACLAARDPDQKIELTTRVASEWERGLLALDDRSGSPVRSRPGLPEQLRLVAPRDVPRRRLRSRTGLAAFVHAIAHIEFNAINLAWDCVQRFRSMPTEFYDDWIGVAHDEARHFGLLRARLAELGHGYGDFPGHGGLWEMAEATADDLMARMALVPRVLEARGLDVTPGLIERCRAVGEEPTAAILRLILAEEVAHVAAGSRWFRWACEARGKDPESAFAELVAAHFAGAIRGPLNTAARLEAGFSQSELEQLSTLATRPRPNAKPHFGSAGTQST
jgi:uncharacterized ferritin-like protein (DUF455 family)